jgi:hypothetical protein
LYREIKKQLKKKGTDYENKKTHSLRDIVANVRYSSGNVPDAFVQIYPKLKYVDRFHKNSQYRI